jgi:hypothetical protein
MLRELKLTCASGDVIAKIGDRFSDHSGKWEIVSFNLAKYSYSPSTIGGTPTVNVKPIGPMQTWLEKYKLDDGTIEFCGDSVAAALTSAEGNKA